jgi:hypothetical protein
MKIGDRFERPEGVVFEVVELPQIDGLRHAKAVRLTPLPLRSATSKKSATSVLIPLQHYVPTRK